MAQVDWPDQAGETARTAESGLVVRLQLRSAQSAPTTGTHHAVWLKAETSGPRAELGPVETRINAARSHFRTNPNRNPAPFPRNHAQHLLFQQVPRVLLSTHVRESWCLTSKGNEQSTQPDMTASRRLSSRSSPNSSTRCPMESPSRYLSARSRVRKMDTSESLS
jgi:hypothetical protein